MVDRTLSDLCCACGQKIMDGEITVLEPDGKIFHARCHPYRPRLVEIAVQQPRIDYCLTPKRFTLDIPVECLERLNEHDITRMIGMLSDWIQRHKPPPNRKETSCPASSPTTSPTPPTTS